LVLVDQNTAKEEAKKKDERKKGGRREEGKAKHSEKKREREKDTEREQRARRLASCEQKSKGGERSEKRAMFAGVNDAMFAGASKDATKYRSKRRKEDKKTEVKQKKTKHTPATAAAARAPVCCLSSPFWQGYS
jgi:hypothetical protein